MQIIVCKRWHLLHSSCKNAAQPKLTTGAVNPGHLVQKAVRIMKLTAFFILATCLHVNATDGFGQKVTLSEREVHIEKIFTEIKKQTGFNFLYTSNILANTHRVTVKVTNALVTEVLDIVLAGQGLEYRVKGEDNLIIIKTKPQIKPIVEVGSPQGGPIDVSGKVTDGEGRALAGANVKVRGSNLGVTTDKDGRFSLKDIPENSVLEITYVGHEMKTFTVRGSGLVNIALDQKLSMLDETVVIAYGQTTRRFVTGNIASVKAADIEKQPVQNPLLALQGRVPGLFITQNTGVPGGGITVRIQGQNSIAKGNDPFFVVDGVPYLNQLPNTGLGGNIMQNSSATGRNGYGDGNPLSYINPSDIESIEVLKDADATAIYGSRAANGAILITTKKGKAGQTKADINVQQGIGRVPRKSKMLNTREYLDMRYEALQNDGIVLASLTQDESYDLTVWDTTSYTDWQNQLIGGSAKFTNISASVSGGSSSTQFLLGGTYHRETTVFPGEFSDRKVALHFNLNNTSSNQKFRIQTSANYMVDNNELPNEDFTMYSMTLEPIAPSLYNADKTINWSPNSSGRSTFSINPAQLLFKRYKNKTTNLVSSLVLSYQIVKGLDFRTSFGYTDLLTKDNSSIPLISVRPERRPTTNRSATYGHRRVNSWIVEPQISYVANVGSNKLDLLLGTTVQEEKSDVLQLFGVGFNSDEILEDIKSAATAGVSYTLASSYKYTAAFGRINYNLKNKYIVNLSARRDGSSRFGPKNRFHNFAAIGTAWIFSEENVIKRSMPFISFGKLRASYGSTGNDQTNDYSFLNLYTPITAGISYQGGTGISTNRIYNPYLEWEETRKLQLGIDIGLLSDMFVVNVTYGRNRSSNQLLNYALPSTAGFSSVSTNFPATVQNGSWEFALQSSIIKNKTVNWNCYINLTIPKNKLVSFPDLETSTYASQLIIGRPLSFLRLYQFLGVDPVTGKYAVADKSGNPTFTPDYLTDANIIVTTLPKYYGGVQNSLSYKGIQLDFLLQFVKQSGVDYKFYNGALEPGNFSAGGSNQPVDVLGRWRKVGDNATHQKFTTTDLTILNATGSDANFRDNSYARLKNLSVSWQLPNNWQKTLRVRGCRIYTQGQNLLTISRYKGLDPESQNQLSLPPLRIWTVGLQIGL